MNNPFADKEEIRFLKEQLEKANSEIMSLKEELKVARIMPVNITTRETIFSAGWAYIFKNESKKTLSLKVTIGHPSKPPKTFDIVVNPAGILGFVEIGKDQGWQGSSGDTVTVECFGYDAIQKEFLSKTGA